jgi:hypothetical protein
VKYFHSVRSCSTVVHGPDTPVRLVQENAELFIYTAVPRPVTVELLLWSPRSGMLHLHTDDTATHQGHKSLSLQIGQQHCMIPLDLEAGETRLVLQADDIEELVVGRINLSY